jgi:hypothetical protein
MMHRVIVQFNSFEDRDQWLDEMRNNISRIYKRNPWLAAELSDAELQRLKARSNVQIFPDAQMRPFMASM